MGRLLELRDIQVGLERIDLAAKGVALDLDIHQAEQGLVAADILRQKDRSGTRAPDGAALAELLQGLHQMLRHGQLSDGR